MGTFAVLGGTGTVGRYIVSALREAGENVRVLARSSPEHRVDLSTGEGLNSALNGCAVVIDASNGSPRCPEPVVVEGSARLVSGAAAAGVEHLVCVSIVGLERIPARYYRAKLEQERIVREGQVPFSIVRSTQFHELVAAALAVLARWRVSPRSGALLQPIAAREAGAAVARIAREAPLAGTLSVAGPEAAQLSVLARSWSAVHPRRTAPVPIPIPPKLGRPLRDGALTCAAPEVRGSDSFAAWSSRDG